MTVSLIVAFSENGVIGRDGDMPWHLSTDLRRFKRLTTGHHLIMGRKTFEAIGQMLPRRTTIILTRDPRLTVAGAHVAHSIDEAIQQAAGDDEVFIAGGGEVYRQALPRVQRMYVTRVHVELEGDTWFPQVDWNQWQLTWSQHVAADEVNQYAFTFENYQRVTAEKTGR